MKTNLFKISVIYAIVIHGLVFLGIYFAWFGSMEGAGAAFCEAARGGIIKQPANTFSNFGFGFLGLLAAFQLSKGLFQGKNAITSNKSIALFFIFLMISLGPGSIAMHATESALGGYFDMLSMYLVGSFMLTYALGRLLSLKPIFYLIIFSVSLAICHYFASLDYVFPLVGFGGNFIFMLLINLGIILEFINNFINKTDKKIKFAYLSVLTLAISFGIWHIGFDHHPWCRPFSFLQAHALWHILDAVALYLLYRYYVSEHDKRFVS